MPSEAQGVTVPVSGDSPEQLRWLHTGDSPPPESAQGHLPLELSTPWEQTLALQPHPEGATAAGHLSRAHGLFGAGGLCPWSLQYSGPRLCLADPSHLEGHFRNEDPRAGLTPAMTSTSQKANLPQPL